MRLKAYTGRSLEELAPRIREELGSEAVVLSQRESVSGGIGGFFGTKRIEVLAADRMPAADDDVEGAVAALDASLLDEPAFQPAFEPAFEPASGGPSTLGARSVDVTDGGADVADLVRAALEQARAANARLDAEQAPAAGQNLANAYADPLAPAARPAEADTDEGPVGVGANVQDDVEEIDASVEIVPARQPRRRTAPTPPPPTPELPELDAEAAAVTDELAAAGVGEALARALVDAVSLHGVPFHADTPLRDLVRDRIAADVTPAAGWPATPGPHVAVFLGPSGSGKTSSILKIAEAYHEAGLAVAVVALDVAVQAVRGSMASRLAEAIDAGGEYDVRQVATVGAARAARKAVADHDLVLVDTPGAIVTDDAALAHVTRLLKALGASAGHVVLPLNLAAREADAALARLAPLGGDRLLVTKIDESRFAGALLDLAHRSRLPLSYLGTGRELRGHLRVADGGFIARRILPIEKP